jgi:hypothetical protein
MPAARFFLTPQRLGPLQRGTGDETVACDDGTEDPLGFGVTGREVQHLLGIGDGIITRGESEPILRQGALRLDENGCDPGGWTRPFLFGTLGEPRVGREHEYPRDHSAPEVG